jgi:hypothetical protein
MAGCAGTGFFASVLDLDIIFKQRVTNRDAAGNIQHSTFRAQRFVGQHNDLRHSDFP